MSTVENISRGDMLQWINDTLKLNITKIETFGTGAIACQLIDCIYPGKVQQKISIIYILKVSKVNWKTKQEYEYVNNFKVLQQAFTKISLNKPLDIEKLTKCKYQDNFEFALWIKRFYDQNTAGRQVDDYDPVARRGIVDIDFSQIEGKGNTLNISSVNSKESSGSKSTVRRQMAPRYATSIMISNNSELNKSQNLQDAKEDNQQQKKQQQQQNQQQQQYFQQQQQVQQPQYQQYFQESIVINNHRKESNSSNSSQTAVNARNKNNFIKNVQSSYELNSFHNSNQIIPSTQPQTNQFQTERDFYFSKLRDIDHLLELYEEMNLGEEIDELVFKIKDILYTSPDQDIIIQPDSTVIVTDKNQAYEKSQNTDDSII